MGEEEEGKEEDLNNKIIEEKYDESLSDNGQ